MTDRPLRLLVCGGRDYYDKAVVFTALDRVRERYGIKLVIEGHAPGADQLAGVWTLDRELPLTIYPAQWKALGPRRAGPIRNQQMLDEGQPDAVVAFPGNAGTRDMVRRAREAGLKVWEPLK